MNQKNSRSFMGAQSAELREISQDGWGLAVMQGALAFNISIASWGNRWARWLYSDILRADFCHTISHVLTTFALISGWQLVTSANSRPGQNREVLDDINRIGRRKKTTR
jgi:divalent metal cation (Fe/Co/Zn/Cd) transporter